MSEQCTEQCSPHMPDAPSEQCTEHMHVRTVRTVRTDEESLSPTRDNNSSVTRTRTYEISPFADLIEEVFDVLGESTKRDVVIRSGEREPINPAKRYAIYARDAFTCQWCMNGGPNLQLDHIIAWSAGGSDRSDNLRTLCQWCNEARSNYLTDNFSRALPVTDRCSECYRDEGDCGPDRVTAYCSRCQMFSWVPDWSRVL